MSKDWPGVWEKDGDTSTYRSDRAILQITRQQRVPEEHHIVLIVYGPNGRADKCLGKFDVVHQGTFDQAVKKARRLITTCGISENVV